MKQHGGYGLTDILGNITNNIGSIISNKSNQSREVQLNQTIQSDTRTKPQPDNNNNNSNQVVPTNYGGKLRRTRKRH